jgi:Flp pilus assembly protein TadD
MVRGHSLRGSRSSGACAGTGSSMRRNFVSMLLCLLLLCPMILRAEEIVAELATVGDMPQPELLPQTALLALAEGNEAFDARDHRRAQTAFRTVLKISPKNLLALTNLGMTEFYLGNLEEAESLLQQAVRERLETAPAWLVLGMLYLDQGRTEEAMTSLAMANLHDPRNARARNFFGVAIGELGWFDGAEFQFRRALEIDPAYADAHFNLAYFTLRRKSPAVELARRHYLRAVELGAERDPEIEKFLQTSP